MNTNLKKGLFFICTAAVLVLPLVSMAQDVTISDLGIETTGILPSNPFYFFKQLGRGIRQSFAFSDLNHAILQLDFLNEQAAEIKKLEEVNPNNLAAFLRAVLSYASAADILKARLAVLKTLPENDKLLDALFDRVLKHQEILDELSSRFVDRDNAKDLESATESAIGMLSGVVASIFGTTFDVKKFEDHFIAAVGKQKGELKEFRAAEFLDRVEEKLPSGLKDEILKLKDTLLLKWSGKLYGIKEGAPLGTSIQGAIVFRALEDFPGDLLRRLRVLDEAREKVGDSAIKNQISIIRQKVLDRIKEKNLISSQVAVDFLTEVEQFIKYVYSVLPEKGEMRANVLPILERASFNLDSAKKFFEEDAYASAYSQAATAFAAAKNAFARLSISPDDFDSELQSLKNYFDYLARSARVYGLNILKNEKLSLSFREAENKIAKLADLVSSGSESPKISSAIRELQLELSAIEQMIQDAAKKHVAE